MPSVEVAHPRFTIGLSQRLVPRRKRFGGPRAIRRPEAANQKKCAAHFLTLHFDVAPHFSTSCWLIASPSPRATEPARGRTPSACVKGQDALRLRHRQADASVPRSARIHDHPPARPRHRQADLTTVGELHRVRCQVKQDLMQAQRIATTKRRQVRIDVHLQIQTLFTRFDTCDSGPPESMVSASQRVEHPAPSCRLRSWKVQDVIDDAQQQISRRLNDLDVACAGEHQRSSTPIATCHDGIHGCSDFVAHRGQKRTF